MEIKLMNSSGNNTEDNAVKSQAKSFLNGKPTGNLGDKYKIKIDLAALRPPKSRIIMCDANCDGPDSWRITMLSEGPG